MELGATPGSARHGALQSGLLLGERHQRVQEQGPLSKILYHTQIQRHRQFFLEQKCHPIPSPRLHSCNQTGSCNSPGSAEWRNGTCLASGGSEWLWKQSCCQPGERVAQQG